MRPTTFWKRTVLGRVAKGVYGLGSSFYTEELLSCSSGITLWHLRQTSSTQVTVGNGSVLQMCARLQSFVSPPLLMAGLASILDAPASFQTQRNPGRSLCVQREKWSVFGNCM